MKRLSLLFIPVIALMALAPLPTLASGGDGGDSGSAASPNKSLGFNTASAFFALYFLSGGNIAIAAFESSSSVGSTPPGETWAEESQRLFAEKVAKDRARRKAERQARQDERDKTAENRSEDALPGLDY